MYSEGDIAIITKFTSEFIADSKVSEKVIYLTAAIVGIKNEPITNYEFVIGQLIASFSESVRKDFSGQLKTKIKESKQAKDAEITEQLRHPLEEQQQLQDELAKLLAEIQRE